MSSLFLIYSFTFGSTHHLQVCLNSSRMEVMTVLSRAECPWVPWELDAKLHWKFIEHTTQTWVVCLNVVRKSITFCCCCCIYSNGKCILYDFKMYFTSHIFSGLKLICILYLYVILQNSADNTVHINLYFCATYVCILCIIY